ncbi:MAG TPA: hypothetical protein PLK12_14735 [Prolixibacteraceae bacterium]|nr:hypothetical protein [Prolixibacteraceae bacterium]
MNRKEFIHTAGRYSILALLGLLAALFIAKRKTTFHGPCTQNFACNRCSLSDRCSIKK